MIALLAAAALTGAGAAASAPASGAPEPSTVESSPSETLASLRDLYQQTCEVRAYGSYDDMCNGLQRQIEDYGRQVVRERRRPRPAATVPATPASPSGASTSGAGSAPALANPKS